MKKRFTTTIIAALLLALSSAAAFSAGKDNAGVIEGFSPRDFKTVATARLDLCFNDGTIYLQALRGQEKLDRAEMYYLVYMDIYAAKIQISSIGGSIIEAKVIPAQAAEYLPTGMIVQIASENLARPAQLLSAGEPRQIASRLRPIRERKNTPPFGIIATVDLVISDSEMVFYPGQYVGLIEGDVVAVSDALGRRIIATVKKADGTFVSLASMQGSAHLFSHGQIVFITDVPRAADWNFISQPDQKILPELPRPVKPGRPILLDEKK